MAGPISEIISTTLRNRSKALADNVSENNALLKRLKRRGNVKLLDGGRTIFHELAYAENSTYKRYSGYETLDISPSDVVTAAEFDWKQIAVAVTMSGLEQLQNSGREALLDLMESRIQVAEWTMANNMSTDIYSAGTADGSKQIGGLQLLVPDDPTTGTAGGINRATYSFWQSKLYDFSVESATPSSTTIQAALNTLYMRMARGPDTPDLFIGDNVYFGYYWASLQSIQRIAKDDDATVGAGFERLRFMGADFYLDGGAGGAAPASHVYGLNTKYLRLCAHKNRNMVPLDPDRYATNQDAVVKLIGWAGNLTTSWAAGQGVIIA